MRIRALVMTTIVALTTGSVAAGPVESATAAPADSAAVVALVNAERGNRGLPALASDPLLDAAAEEWAAHLNSTGAFEHSSPAWRAVRITAAGWPSGSGENIARGYTSAAAVMNGWMNSTGHRNNILSAFYGGIGVGRVGNDWVQIFTLTGGRMPLGSAPTIAGSAALGGTLTASITGWRGDSRVTWRWLANGSPIPGATASTFRPTLAEAGASISVEARFQLSGFSPEVRTSTSVAGPAAVSTRRVAGDDRFATAAAVSRQYFPSGASTVYVANGLEFPDALSTGPVAASRNAPILLTTAGALPSTTLGELQRLRPSTIVVVGGPGAVSADVVARLATVTPNVERVAGADRFATSRAIASHGFASANLAYVATGHGFADALAAGPAAGAANAPVILEDGAAPAASSATIALLRDLGVTRVRIAGGTGSVSAGIHSSLASAGFTVERFGGADRFSTAALINQAGFSSASRVFVSNGFDFPDALSAGPVAAMLGAPLYTTHPTCIPREGLVAMGTHSPTEVVLLGGTGALSTRVSTLTGC